MTENERQGDLSSPRSAVMERRENLVNLAELLVKEKLTQVMERMGVCNCEKCTNDVLAITLNSIPPKYVTTDSGKQYLQLNLYKDQYETDIIAALTKACTRVKSMPRHP
ncbi:MAG: late competence development ComFB family protein [Anaerovoracaceae bacterium]|jgi:competence protein ComFB